MKKLAGWKGKLLSIARRILLLNTIIRQIDRLWRGFLWCSELKQKNGKHLLVWSKVCQPKKLGDMGVTDLQFYNQILFCKWWWNLFRDEKMQKPWSKLISIAYYNQHSAILQPLPEQQLSEFWKQAQKMRVLFHNLIKFRIQNGLRTSFWYDSWLLNQPLKEKYPSLFFITPKKDITVAEAYIQIMNNTYWPFSFHLNTYPEFQQLKQELTTLDLSQGCDSPEWKWFPGKKFSSKQCYFFLMDGGVRPMFSKIVWGIRVPEKIKYFIYLNFYDRILTKSNLAKHGWQGKNIFSLCDLAPETVDHLLLQCPFPRQVWSTVTENLHLKDLPQNQNSLWCSWRFEEPINSLQQHLDILLATGLWTLWKERNNRCFQCHAFLPKPVVIQIARLYTLWTKHLFPEPASADQPISDCMRELLGRTQVGSLTGRSSEV